MTEDDRCTGVTELPGNDREVDADGKVRWTLGAGRVTREVELLEGPVFRVGDEGRTIRLGATCGVGRATDRTLLDGLVTRGVLDRADTLGEDRVTRGVERATLGAENERLLGDGARLRLAE